MFNSQEINLTEVNDFYNDLYKDRKEEASAPEEVKASSGVPNGEYKVSVNNVRLSESKSGKPQLKWVLEIEKGAYQEDLLWHCNTLTKSKESMDQLRRDLSKFGVKLDSLDDLRNQKFLSQFVGRCLIVCVERDNTFVNAHFLKAID